MHNDVRRGGEERKESGIQWLNKQAQQKTAAQGASGGKAALTDFF